MYLTRIQLDLTKTKTMQALVAPKLFHGAIECAEPEGRTRKLWRLDTLNGNQYLLILTESPLDFSEVVRQFGTGTCAETKKYDVLLDRITNGSKWQFRLKANPVVYKKIAQSKRGKPVAHITTGRIQGSFAGRMAGKTGGETWLCTGRRPVACNRI